MPRKMALGAAVAAAMVMASVSAHGFTGVIERVTDADTFYVGGTEIRLDGIDAPDPDQICTRAGEKYKCGEEAQAALLRIVAGRVLTCQQVGEDLFKRAVVRCQVGNFDLGAELVRQGWAVAFKKFSKRYVAQENEARKAKRGLWEGKFDRPRDWRRKKKNWVN